jgi:hypothetical protein
MSRRIGTIQTTEQRLVQLPRLLLYLLGRCRSMHVGGLQD